MLQEEDERIERKGSDEFTRGGIRGKSLWLFDGKNKFRQSVTSLVGHPYFTNFILLVIIVSAIQLALDSPL